MSDRKSALWGRNADFPTNNDIFPTKKICRAAFGEVGRVGCGYSCDFYSRWYGFTPDDTLKIIGSKTDLLTVMKEESLTFDGIKSKDFYKNETAFISISFHPVSASCLLLCRLQNSPTNTKAIGTVRRSPVFGRLPAGLYRSGTYTGIGSDGTGGIERVAPTMFPLAYISQSLQHGYGALPRSSRYRSQ